MRKTKIVSTLGPASEHIDQMRGLFQGGISVARFNFSHGDHEEHGKRLKTVRILNKELSAYVGTMLDTKGPEIRTNEFKDGKVEIARDSIVRIAFKEVLGTPEKFSVTYNGLYDDVEVGQVILVDDGYLELIVTEKDSKARELITKAVNRHVVKSRRGVNVPNVVLNMPFISDKDKADIEFGADNDYDFIATSFTRRAEDVEEVREILRKKGKGHIQIIAKIENQEGVDNIEEIIEASDGIMVARGDLGVEITPEDLPSIQKEMVAACQEAGKIVIVATQMLESMQNNPRPTRAEISDVANAVYEGTDCTMLSGESAAGQYPSESVRYMARINKRTEYEVDYPTFVSRAYYNEFLYGESESSLVAHAIANVSLGYSIKAVVTESVELAKILSKYRVDMPIIVKVKTNQQATALSANYGIYAVLTDKEVQSLIERTDCGCDECDCEDLPVIYATSKTFELK